MRLQVGRVVSQRKSTRPNDNGLHCSVLRRPLEQTVLRGQRDVLEATHAREHALAGAGPHVRDRRDDVQPVRDAVVGRPQIGLGRDGSDIAIPTLQRSFPVLIQLSWEYRSPVNSVCLAIMIPSSMV